MIHFPINNINVHVKGRREQTKLTVYILNRLNVLEIPLGN